MKIIKASDGKVTNKMTKGQWGFGVIEKKDATFMGKDIINEIILKFPSGAEYSLLFGQEINDNGLVEQIKKEFYHKIIKINKEGKAIKKTTNKSPILYGLREYLIKEGYQEEDADKISEQYYSGGLEAAVKCFEFADDEDNLLDHDYTGELREYILEWEKIKVNE